MTTNSQRSIATRNALIAAARALFAEKGFADTSTPEIVLQAKVTRGALYHHFADKIALFRAVVVAEYETVADEISVSCQNLSGSAIESLRMGSHGYLNAMKDQGRVRIMLRDGPAVLGMGEIDRIDQLTSADTLRQGLAEAMRDGQIKPLPIDPLTSLLSAMFDRAALAIADGADRQQHLEVLDATLAGLVLQSA